jgi:hypothetical protein
MADEKVRIAAFVGCGGHATNSLYPMIHRIEAINHKLGRYKTEKKEVCIMQTTTRAYGLAQKATYDFILAPKIRCIQLLQLFIFIFGVWGVFSVPLSSAGTFRDDFDSPSLNTDRWEIATAGKAKHFIEKGQLFLESPAVADGIILYFKQKLEGDVTVECKMDPSNVDPGTLGAVGFTDGIFDPEPSPAFWVHWLAHFNFSPTISNPYIDDYPGKGGFPKAGNEFNFPAESHVWKFVLKGGKMTYFFDGEEMGESDAVDAPRYFHNTPDCYTSHYLGTLAIDYVEIIGEKVKPSAVSSTGKLALMWGTVKNMF